MRFDRRLYYVNASFFEGTIRAAVTDRGNSKYVLAVVGRGVVQLDPSGEEVVNRLAANDIAAIFGWVTSRCFSCYQPRAPC
jgi:hypothetical protein